MIIDQVSVKAVSYLLNGLNFKVSSVKESFKNKTWPVDLASTGCIVVDKRRNLAVKSVFVQLAFKKSSFDEEHPRTKNNTFLPQCSFGFDQVRKWFQTSNFDKDLRGASFRCFATLGRQSSGIILRVPAVLSEE